jgi:MFS transporter, DHA1 family, multidrug resistance protein
MAANTVARSACGAAAPLFTEYMFNALGVGGGGSLIAGVACLLAPIPFVFYKYGEPIRKRSKFAPTPPPGHQDVETGDAETETKKHRRQSIEEEDLELDEEAGFPEPRDLDKEMNQREKVEAEDGTGSETGGSTNNLDEQRGGDRYLDDRGLEKAE